MASRPCASGPTAPAGRVALERYRLDERLGAGGFGVVWRAHDLKLERDVAVKAVPRAGGEADQARTEREALAAAKLNHPGIVALYEFGYDDEQIYLVSELVEGATLGELTRRGRAVGPRRGQGGPGAGRRACARARPRGDPPRRQAGERDGAGRARRGRRLRQADRPRRGARGLADELTATGDVVGTLAYMAPEQAEGQRITAACDVYRWR